MCYECEELGFIQTINCGGKQTTSQQGVLTWTTIEHKNRICLFASYLTLFHTGFWRLSCHGGGVGWGRQKVFAAHNSKSIQVILRNFGTVISNHKSVQMVHFNCHILRHIDIIMTS